MTALDLISPDYDYMEDSIYILIEESPEYIHIAELSDSIDIKESPNFISIGIKESPDSIDIAYKH